MVPSRLIWQQYQDLLAADTTTLADATAMKVSLVAQSFVPDLDLSISGLTLASFTGSAPKSAGIGDQQTFYDPATGQRLIQILEPAGGWTWICTVAPSPQQVIFGWLLTDNAGTVLFGSELLSQPITISAVGQAVTIPNLRFRFNTNSPT